MGTGWRRARNALGLTVCTSIPRDDLDALDSAAATASPRAPADCSSGNGGFGAPMLGFAEGGGSSCVSSPRLQQLENVGSASRLQCQTSPSPRLRCQTGGNSSRVQSSLSQVSGSSPRMCSQSQCSPRLQCRTSASPRVRNIENVPLTEGSVPSSPRSPSRLSLLRNSIRLSRSTCAMCLQTMKPGQGHAIFTAECSHAFHFPCIASNVKHGNLVCPVCRAKWKEVPSQVTVSVAHKEVKAERTSVLTPRSSNRRTSNNIDNTSDISSESSFTPRGSRQIAPSEPLYDDDEPLDPNPRSNGATTAFSTIHEEEEEFEFKGFVVEPEAVQNKDASSETSALRRRNVEISIQPEVQVLAAGKSCENFTVLLQVRAPPANPPQQKTMKQNSPSLILDPNYRASIDLVTVLDISGSMSGTKLQLLKRAMRLVISSLSPADRLSVVVFSASAKRVFPLRRMAPQGQRAARRVIDRLVCSEGTNVPDALKKAAKILEDRRERNPVASIMLLSDGQDKRSFSTPASTHSDLASIRQSTRYGHIEIPVHAFGFGSDQSAAKMHAISSESGAEDAFAQCIGGLLSVVVQDVQLTVSCCSTPGVELQSIYAGSFQTRVLDDYGTVKLGDLYADEERDIIVELKVPAVRYPNSMNVLSVNCSFKDPVTQQVMYGKEQSLSIPRPESTRGFPNCINFQVDKYKIKLRTAQAIGEARTMVDRGDANGAQQVLYKAKAMLNCAAATRTVDQMRSALEAEIKRIQARMIRERESRDRLHREPATPTSSSVLDIIMRYETDSNGEALTPTSAWRAAERLAKVAMMRKSLNRVSDLHGFENARF
ncbi:hypothetical protein SUGI_0597230 [Cryptomeria japonica]|uniref:E3 ubiquitin-protein ligase WAV3 n=1 Tax=Cryptomeria japonica TaxID=3369 RepID=UPI002414A044|nr:E3 ubiquitin-protein ligase WAV3 [Cryptomeria japonica]GLJ30195.1 hypothetical protein SUGI_0597230 [Cryptomeria japonica]